MNRGPASGPSCDYTVRGRTRHLPVGAGPFPAVILVHGGGWEAGDRSMERPLAKQLAAHGFVAAPVTYRLARDGRFPAAVHDLKEAVRRLRAHAAEYAIESSHIGAIGGSAGGHLVAFLGATNGKKEFDEAGASADQPSIVQAVVDIDGAANFPDASLIPQEDQTPGATSRFLGGPHSVRAAVWQMASPLAHVGRDSAPTLFINSTAPRPILPGRPEMSAKLKALGIDSQIVVIPETPHPFGSCGHGSIASSKNATDSCAAN